MKSIKPTKKKKKERKQRKGKFKCYNLLNSKISNDESLIPLIANIYYNSGSVYPLQLFLIQ